MSARALAPAKINLFLHVGPPGGDGWHPLVSLMTFADIGDAVSFSPAPGQSLVVRGPCAEGLSAGEDNLVLRAARGLLAHGGRPDAGFRLSLHKRLPIAAGLGGGSSDAGAALRLLNAGLGLGAADAELEAIAAGLGADGAACFRAAPVLAQGRGERLGPAPRWPDLPCVLVNPGVGACTPDVYRAFDAMAAFGDVSPPALPDLHTVEGVAECLGRLRNDLEAAAVAVQPGAAAPLQTLAAAPEALLTRMSGSGSTSFALCRDGAGAEALSRRLAAAHPAWWVRACRLAGG